MPIIEQWTQTKASDELRKRFITAKQIRHKYEDEWKRNEAAMYEMENSQSASHLPSDIASFDSDDGYESMSELKLNYAMKYVRFILSQMSSNPPSAIPKPTSQDYKDRRAANVANSYIQYGIREYDAHEEFDLVSNDTLVDGIGWLRTWFNPHLGDINSVEGDNVTTTGDMEFKRISPWDVYWDSGAKCWKDVRYVFIEHKIPLEQAQFLWPQHADALVNSNPSFKKGFFDSDDIEIKQDMVTVLEYIEKKLPWNGGVGRYGWMLEGGLLLTDISKSPFPDAALPVKPLTDIDMPGHIPGKAVMAYLARAQEVLTALDSTILDNIQAHGVVRLVLPDGAQLQDDGLTNHGWEFIKTSGGAGNAPFFMSAPQLMPDMHQFRANIIAGMQEIAGVNESMMGQVNREMSGFSLQTAIEAGNQVRRRLFKKYTSLVKWSWGTYLANIQKYFTTKRQLVVVGEEEGLDVAYYSGADLKGGYDIQVDYGESFSLDPARRREEIMQLAPMLEKAGLSPQEILSKIKLNDIKGLYDINSMAARRQEEIFETMIAKSEEGVAEYIAPQELQEHQGMLAAAYKYIMTRRYFNLPSDVQALIAQHVKAREKMAAATAQPAPAMAPPAPAMPGPVM